MYSPGSYLVNPLTLYQVDKHYAYLRFINNSPYQLTVNMSGAIVNIPEFRVKDVALPVVFQGLVIVSPALAILTKQHAQANQLTIEAYYPGEITTPQDSPIPQQAVDPTASGNPLFTVNYGNGATTNIVQLINIYNPSNSGVVAVFYSAVFFVAGAASSQAVLAYQSGADNAFTRNVAPICHTLNGVLATSAMHCTTANQGTYPGIPIEDRFAQNMSDSIDVMRFPDTMSLYPGGQVILASANSGNLQMQISGKWSEQSLT